MESLRMTTLSIRRVKNPDFFHLFVPGHKIHRKILQVLPMKQESRQRRHFLETLRGTPLNHYRDGPY